MFLDWKHSYSQPVPLSTQPRYPLDIIWLFFFSQQIVCHFDLQGEEKDDPEGATKPFQSLYFR